MKNIIITISVLLIVILTACDPENVNIGQKKYNDTLDTVWDTTSVASINLNNTSITASKKSVIINGATATITKPGNYKISGILQDGQIIVKTTEDGRVRLILNNVNITNSTTSPLFIANAERTIIILPKGTENTFTDANNYTITADSLNAPIFSKDDLAIFGEGVLNVNGNYKGGITSRDELDILSGTINVNSVTTGIRGKDNLRIENGTFNINCGGDALKADNDSTETKGFINIKNGSFKLVSNFGDGITASKVTTIEGGIFDIETGGGSEVELDSTAASTKGIKGTEGTIIKGGTFVINSSDNCIHSSKTVEISGGDFTIFTGNRALKADSTLTITDGNFDIKEAFKGISSHKIKIRGGNITINSRNDCLKATLGEDITENDGSSLEINGGTLLLSTEKGDAVDSNGSIEMLGGTLVLQGSQTDPDEAISHRSTFTISGGNLIAAGAKTLAPTSGTLQNSVLIRFRTYLSPNVHICIQDENNSPVIIFKIQRYALYALFSTSSLTTGKTYNIYSGGTASGTEKNGFYLSGVYTPGTKRGSFTLNAGHNTVLL